MSNVDFRKGDIIEVGGKEYEVYAVRPTHRTYGEGAGEKYVYPERGLTFIDDNDSEYWLPIKWAKFVRRPNGNDSEGVTVLPDDNLGGVLREYREVKRNANVGERIKIVAASESFDEKYVDGDILTVISAPYSHGAVNANLNGERAHVFSQEYVVLEPTEIVRIGSSERYRMVDRQANDGERIIVTAAEDNTDSITGIYENGAIFTVEYSGEDIVDCVGGVLLYHWEYRVLEPVESDEPTEQVSDEIPQQIEDILRRLAKVEQTLSSVTVDVSLLEDGVSDDIIALTERVTSLEGDRKAMDDRIPTDLSRDEIVKRARADVAELERIGRDVDARLPRESSFYSDFYRIKFEINREKRTAVALVTDRHSDRVRSRGIAKCAPGDTFNVYIGKAIAIRRALGLPVPDEYVNAPQPLRLRAGDAVEIRLISGAVEANKVIAIDTHKKRIYLRGREISELSPSYVTITDDSDRYTLAEEESV